MPAQESVALLPSNFVEVLGRLNVSHMEQSIIHINRDRPVNLVTALMDDMDQTQVDLTNVEMFEVRQIAEDGTAHVVLLTKAMAIELMGLMNAWVSIG